MTRKTMMMVAWAMMGLGGSALAQQPDGAGQGTQRNYFVKTNNVKETTKQVAEGDSTAAASAAAAEPQQDFISRNFRYISMCDWEPGLRFMCIPSKEDFVVKTFAEAKTGNLISSRKLVNKILVYDGHDNATGSLHEHVNFHLEENPAEMYYFEVPTASFDDYCYGKTGVPMLAYLGDVDMAIDSLVGKKVRVLVRHLYQDSETQGGGFRLADIGKDRVGEVMTITKVGVGTRNFPVKIIVQETGKDGQEGKEYFQYVTISHTNCGMRDDEFDRSDNLPHTFKGSFLLLDDRLAVSPELQQWKGKTVYTFFDTQMRDADEKPHTVLRLSTFTVEDIFKLGDSELVTLTLKGRKSGNIYTKEVSATNTRVTGKEEILNELFIEGDPDSIPNIRKANLPYIQKQQVKKGFNEDEVRLALGEPTDVTRLTADTYQWIYQYKDEVDRPFRTVKFSRKTKLVTQDMTR